jgi:hypothetical protein
MTSAAKLDALRRLAADERTPIEEARNAALAFVRGGGKVDAAPAAGDDAQAKLAELERRGLAILEQKWTLERRVHELEQENARLRAMAATAESLGARIDILERDLTQERAKATDRGRRRAQEQLAMKHALDAMEAQERANQLRGSAISAVKRILCENVETT